MIQFLVAGITEALMSRRILVLHQEDWPWMKHAFCGQASLECYFLPLTNCSSFKVELLPVFLPLTPLRA